MNTEQYIHFCGILSEKAQGIIKVLTAPCIVFSICLLTSVPEIMAIKFASRKNVELNCRILIRDSSTLMNEADRKSVV